MPVKEVRPLMDRLCDELQGLKEAVITLIGQQWPPTAGPHTRPQSSAELRDAVLADVRGMLNEELRQLHRELQKLSEVRPLMDRLCDELKGLKEAVITLTEQQSPPTAGPHTRPQSPAELRDAVLADVRDMLNEELRQLRRELQELSEVRPLMDRLCDELKGLKEAVITLTEQQWPPTAGPHTRPQSSAELRDAVLADVRGMLNEELRQLRRELQELSLEVAQMKNQKQLEVDQMKNQKQLEAQVAPQLQPPAIPQELFSFGGKAPATAAPTIFGSGFSNTTPATGTVCSTDGGLRFGQAPSAWTGRTTTGASAAASTGFSFGPTTATPSTQSAAASLAASPATTTGLRFGQGLTSVSFTTPTASTSAAKTSLGGFSFTTTPNIKKSEPVPATATTTQSEAKPSPFAGFSFSLIGQGSAGALSFAAVADSGPGFKKDCSFIGFTGSGAPAFGSSPARGADGQDLDTTTEEYEPSVHFEPVVPLPELVDTKTGEESEEKLFGHCAKLYRMDTATKEWKERGIGEIKILKNADTGKCRVLMRREQVLKLCANHVIRPEMSLMPLKSSQSVWVWSASDFSEGEASQETLAVKFRTPELVGAA
ncbi:RANBP2-like and GRIP domain-containing protein 5/6 [Amphibalanus amphitrite]|uniref:RANBP2-like and GRIP domain-containing protein 5/6 n=1 Tax=Amphibalanus amphitrite TaxID=1232801 RepID=A0A6A4UZX4_AMPAM|nr:RANBP2-like and GRIP domain-containing protein 5/6 [Amphibalanus amphitrite]